MRIVLLITLLEALVLTSWLLLQRYRRQLRSGTIAVMPGATLAVEPNQNAARWAFIDESHLEGQANDRRPMLDTVAGATGSPAARRSSARRSHQLNFKKWSTERHD